MSTATLPPPSIDSSAIRRFSVEEYLHLVDSGFFNNEEKLELIEGWIVDKMPHNAPHDYALMQLMYLLIALDKEVVLLRGQSSLPLDTSVPEPDYALVRGPASRYLVDRPTANDVVLSIEISDSSLQQDQGVKLKLYARNKIPTYWIVNLIDKRVEVYTLPRDGKNPTYRNRTDYAVTDSVPVIVQGQTLGLLPVNEFIPQ